MYNISLRVNLIKYKYQQQKYYSTSVNTYISSYGIGQIFGKTGFGFLLINKAAAICLRT